MIGSLSPILVNQASFTSDTGVLANTYGRALYVMVSGGVGNLCGNNSYHIKAVINGIAVANASNSNTSYYKEGFMSFLVPIGGTYRVISSPYSCPGRGYFSLSVMTI